MARECRRPITSTVKRSIGGLRGRIKEKPRDADAQKLHCQSTERTAASIASTRFFKGKAEGVSKV